MSFRTVVVGKQGKLDLQLNYLVYRGEKEKRVYISEISLLIVESTAVSITAALLVELVKQKVKVIFCDEKHLPCFQLVGYDDNFHSSLQIKKQIAWTEQIKKKVWDNIVYHKIKNQARLLKKFQCSHYTILDEYLEQISDGDVTNREGHAAKIYFNYLFGGQGRRVVSFSNSALNYGYAILLSMFCREITASGCITQLGIFHCNEYNPYNLASDFMETFRVVVDETVLSLESDDANFKRIMQNIVNYKVKIAGKQLYLDAAVEVYVKSVINALNNNNTNLIKNMEGYELSIYENNGNV